MGKLYQTLGTVTLVNNTGKELLLTVPDGKIWKIYAVRMHNGDDVARNQLLKVVDSNSNSLHFLGYVANATAGNTYEMLSHIPTSPQIRAPFVGGPVLVKGGNKLSLTWQAGGASSGGTAQYCVTYEEVAE